MTTENLLWFIFHNNTLLLLPGQKMIGAIPCSSEPPLGVPAKTHRIGNYKGLTCIAYAVEALPEEVLFQPVELRYTYDIIGESLYILAGRGYELIYWDRHSRFCPVCGTAMDCATDISKRCPQCRYEMFPNIAVAVLVLVRKEDSILLVRAHNFKGPFYGCIAGFLEAGETLEECVKREVKEETALEVDTIRYFGCQPWPYPSSLIVGFVADYEEGDICLQEEELSEAAFFSRYDLPELPHKFSLARQMIDWWLNEDDFPDHVRHVLPLAEKL